jgi:hypothetical protein
MPSLSTSVRFREAKAGYIWRNKGGDIMGSLDLGEAGDGTWLAFSDPAEARAMAAELEVLAGRMEAFPPAGEEEAGG